MAAGWKQPGAKQLKLSQTELMLLLHNREHPDTHSKLAQFPLVADRRRQEELRGQLERDTSVYVDVGPVRR